jgi:23S rRNA maturation-related 3'-5' exoribonuclease YhaM
MKTITKDAADDLLLHLRVQADQLGVENIAGVVLNDTDFFLWSGSSIPDAHHYGDHGLIVHTHEVWSLCRAIALWDREIHDNVPGERKIFLAALFHDYGKLWDYSKVSDGSWVSNSHKRHIHHIQRSAIEWGKAVARIDGYHDIEDEVTHAILAHHGQKAWGSVVAPKTKLAWLLHICDQMSARMDDGECNQYLQTHNP